MTLVTIAGSARRPDRAKVENIVASSTVLTSSVPSTPAHTGAMRPGLRPSRSAMVTKLAGRTSTMSWAYTVLIERRMACTRFASTGASGSEPSPPLMVHRGPHTSGRSISSSSGAS